MKRLSWLLVIPVVFGLALFTGCEELGDDVLGPEITFKAGTGLITENTTVQQGTNVKFSWEAVAGDANLAEFTIRLGALDVPGFPNDDIDKDEYQATWDTTLTEIGDYEFTFIATDKNDEQAIETIMITVEEGPITLEEYTTILLGAQSSSEASTASLETGTRYSIANDEAKNNSDKVDIVHYNGAKDVALYSPSNSDIQGVSAYDISNWSTKNDTKMLLTGLSASEFDAISTDDDLEAAVTSDPTESFVGFLGVDDVVSFETASGKKGVFKVSALEDAANGSVTINIKVMP